MKPALTDAQWQRGVLALVVFCLCAMVMALTMAEADPAQQDPDWEKVMKLLVLPQIGRAHV